MRKIIAFFRPSGQASSESELKAQPPREPIEGADSSSSAHDSFGERQIALLKKWRCRFDEGLPPVA